MSQDKVRNLEYQLEELSQEDRGGQSTKSDLGEFQAQLIADFETKVSQLQHENQMLRSNQQDAGQDNDINAELTRQLILLENKLRLVEARNLKLDEENQALK